MTTITDTIAGVLREHEIVEVLGGTATGSTWHCYCRAEGTSVGSRGHAHHLGLQHVAERIAAAIEPEMQREEARIRADECRRAAQDLAAGKAGCVAANAISWLNERADQHEEKP